MATVNITDAGAVDIVHIDNGSAKVVTTGGALDLPCSKVEVDQHGNFVGTVATETTENSITYAAGDQVVFELAQITALTATA